MRRRRGPSSDESGSDLLLDTLCNMFGGIIFLALLIVILSSGSVMQLPVQQTEARALSESHALSIQLAVWNEELDLLLPTDSQERLELEKLAAMVTGLRRQLLRLEGLGLQLVEREKEITTKKTEAQLEFERALAVIESLEAQMKSPDVSKIEKAAREERHAITSLEAQLSKIRQRRVLKSRLPLERSTEKHTVWIWLRGDRAFLIGPSDDEFPEDDITQQIAATTVSVSPKGRGFVVDDQLRNHARFSRITSDYPSTRYYISLAVRSDAHANFRRWKAALIQANFGYNLEFLEDDLMIFIYGGFRGRTQ